MPKSFQMPKRSPSTKHLYIISRPCSVSHFTVHLQMQTCLDIWQEIAHSREIPDDVILRTLLQLSFRPHELQRNVTTGVMYEYMYDYVQDVLAILTKYPLLIYFNSVLSINCLHDTAGTSLVLVCIRVCIIFNMSMCLCVRVYIHMCV